MKIEFDEDKRQTTLLERGLDFADAAQVFDGSEFTWEDDRFDYLEKCFNTFGMLNGRLVSVTWMIGNGNRRIISMRKANGREQARYRKTLG